MPEAPPAPRTLADVTPEWLDAVLRHRGLLKTEHITSIEVQPVSDVEGFMSRTVRLIPAYSGIEASAPESLIAKVATDVAEIRAFLFDRNLYQDEIRFYQELAPDCGISVPACYFSGYDLEARRVGLLLEDLSGMRPGDQMGDTRLHDIELAVDVLARLHAAFWDGLRTREYGWLRGGTGIKPAGNAGDWVALPTDVKATLPDAAFRLGERLCAGEYDLLAARLRTPPLTLMHGDYRLDNLFFGMGPNSDMVTVIDWQTVSHCHGAIDLGWLLGVSTPTALRRDHEEDLIRRYHHGLIAHGVTNYDFDRCWTDYRAGIANAFWRFVGTYHLSNWGSDRGQAVREAFAQRSSAAAADLGGEKLLDDLKSE